uniref:Uncharacterized protein n=1 Tax=Romanomermis culicivorax TaxID=13658 RepID=A0A915K1W3_ROMCU
MQKTKTRFPSTSSKGPTILRPTVPYGTTLSCYTSRTRRTVPDEWLLYFTPYGEPVFFAQKNCLRTTYFPFIITSGRFGLEHFRGVIVIKTRNYGSYAERSSTVTLGSQDKASNLVGQQKFKVGAEFEFMIIMENSFFRLKMLIDDLF